MIDDNKIKEFKRVLTEDEVKVMKKRERLLHEIRSIEKIVNNMKNVFIKNENEAKGIIDKKQSELRSLENKCNGHIWDIEENMMGKGICVICGYDDY
jgi:hypothetical protein